MKRAKPKAPRETITIEKLSRLAFCNSRKLTQAVEINGQRMQWVGIGWVNEGEPKGDEILVKGAR